MQNKLPILLTKEFCVIIFILYLSYLWEKHATSHLRMCTKVHITFFKLHTKNIDFPNLIWTLLFILNSEYLQA